MKSILNKNLCGGLGVSSYGVAGGELIKMVLGILKPDLWSDVPWWCHCQGLWQELGSQGGREEVEPGPQFLKEWMKWLGTGWIGVLRRGGRWSTMFAWHTFSCSGPYGRERAVSQKVKVIIRHGFSWSRGKEWEEPTEDQKTLKGSENTKCDM